VNLEFQAICELEKRIAKLEAAAPPAPEKIHSCKGHHDQVFCNDPNCGRRDSAGFHWPMGHPQNKFVPENKPDAVEEKVNQILANLPEKYNKEAWRDHLDELVRLAREQK